uniref:Uncharacterized protein n=1 Tax=Ciona savignyi TaxID=51511 RepID=H2YFN0_CIOSA
MLPNIRRRRLPTRVFRVRRFRRRPRANQKLLATKYSPQLQIGVRPHIGFYHRCILNHTTWRRTTIATDILRILYLLLMFIALLV